MSKLRFKRKAVSPVITILLIIIIAIAAALIAYAWVIGYLGFTTQKASNAIQIQSVTFDDPFLKIYVQNVGQGTVQFNTNECVYIDGLLNPDCTPVPPGDLKEGNTVILNVRALQAFVNQRAKIKVITIDGTFAELTTTITTRATSITHTITASAGAGGSINPSGAVIVDHGADQTFAITADDGYHVFDVVVDGTQHLGEVSFYAFTNVIADHTISATFVPESQVTYTITASAGAGGSISPSGAVTVSDGADQAFTITPDQNYHIVDVVVDDTTHLGSQTSYTFTDVIADHTISATFAINTYTITASAEAGGSISPSGSIVVNAGVTQVFTITPDAGNKIFDVVVDGTQHKGAVSSYAFTNVQADHTISATFVPSSTVTHMIIASAGSGGSITPSGSVTVVHGSSQAFIITPDSGYFIAGVLVDGASQGSIGSYTFTNVQADHTISATFVVISGVQHKITASAGTGGIIAPEGEVWVNHGADQAFAIAPNAGYHIVDVVVDSVSQGVRTSYTFTNVVGDHTISATFAAGQGPVTHTITASAGAGGSISPSGAVTVSDGADQAFTITPNTGYHVSDVLVDGGSVGAVTSYTFINVQANHVISASFAQDTGVTFTITASAGSGGSITPSGSVVVNQGATQVFTITPISGYHIVDVVVDSVSQGAIGTYTFTNIQANHVISASFAQNTGVTHTITASAGTGGFISPSGSVVVNDGASQVFTISPISGYHIVDVVVDGVSQGAVNSYTFTNVQANHVIIASFAANTGVTFTITASAGSGGSITPSGSVIVNQGATQVFTITPNSGYNIADVIVDSVHQGPIGTYTFTNVQANHVISASFAQDTGVTFTITASAGSGGSISPSGSVVVNQSATQVFTITPNTGYHVVDVVVDSVSQGAIGTYTFTNVQANHVISASFAQNTITFTITASAGSGGSISPSGSVVVNQGATQVFTITANTGYKIFEVIVDGVSQGTINSYTFSNVQANHVITASFVTQNSVIENFNGEGDSWDDNWDYWGNPPWRRATDQHRSAPASATCDVGDDGPFTSDPTDTRGANAIRISFWYMVLDTESTDLKLYYTGNANPDPSNREVPSWTRVPEPNFNIGKPASDMTWYKISFTIGKTSGTGDFVDASAFSSTFRFSLYSFLGTNEQIWVDDICIELIP